MSYRPSPTEIQQLKAQMGASHPPSGMQAASSNPGMQSGLVMVTPPLRPRPTQA